MPRKKNQHTETIYDGNTGQDVDADAYLGDQQFTDQNVADDYGFNDDELASPPRSETQEREVLNLKPMIAGNEEVKNYDEMNDGRDHIN